MRVGVRGVRLAPRVLATEGRGCGLRPSLPRHSISPRRVDTGMAIAKSHGARTSPYWPILRLTHTDRLSW